MGTRVSREDGTRPLFGREEYVAEAERLVDQAVRGQGGGLLLRGTGGMGKSQLLRTIGHRSRERRCRVLLGRALPEELPPPFSLIRDLVRPISAGVPTSTEVEVGAVTLPIFLASFAVSSKHTGWTGTPGGSTVEADELEGLLTPLASAAHGGYLAGREELLARLGNFFIQVARRQPLVLAVDDLHFADDSSLDFLRRFASELPVVPIAFIATVAEGAEVPERARTTLEELGRAPSFRSKTLRPLSAAEVDELIRWIMGGARPLVRT